MSIDFESLLEFEESLRESVTSSNALLLANLDLKLETNRYPNQNTTENAYLGEYLGQLLQDYDFSQDEFATCSKCGTGLCRIADYNSCCGLYVECQKHMSSLEQSYWLSFLDNPTRTINTMPNYTELLILQQGIPAQLRALVWQKLVLLNCYGSNGVPETSQLIFKNFQHLYNKEISTQISKDLLRTFPAVDFFKHPDTISSLSTILNVYANYDAALGYCQGLLFLVGLLHYRFQNCELTFHTLVTVMDTEPQLHDIFTPLAMSSTLNKWLGEFMGVLQAVDAELAAHLSRKVDLLAFLFQWWLSFVCSHTPDLTIVNRIIDFCLLQGWKVGMLKISLGLLVSNKPILMSLGDGDEEVVYQHLLNDLKWGVVVNSLDTFFGHTLLSWDDNLFAFEKNCAVRKNSHKRSLSTVMEKFRSFGLYSSRNRSNSSTLVLHPPSNQSSVSVFSVKKASDNESLYSDITSTHSDGSESPGSRSRAGLGDFLKLPSYFSKPSKDDPFVESLEDENLHLAAENEQLKALLRQAYGQLEDDTLKNDIFRTVGMS